MLERSTHVGAHRRGRVITIDWRRDGSEPGRVSQQHPTQDRPARFALPASDAAAWAVRVERRLVDVLGVPGEGRERHVTGPWAVGDLREEALRVRGDARINAYVVRPVDADPFVIVAPFEGRHPRKTFCRAGMRMVVGGVYALVDAFVGASVLTLLQPPADLRRSPFYVVGQAAPRHAAPVSAGGHGAGARRRSG